MRKFFEEACLLDQTYVIDGESKVEEIVEAKSKEADAPVSISGFGLFVLGEGVEKTEEDFAAEVTAAISN